MKIRFIGYGVQILKHLTLNAVEQLTAAKKVLYIPTIAADVELLLRKLAVAQSEDISCLYVDGANDYDNYERIVQKVISEARTVNDVALMLPGHPRLGVTPLQLLETSPEYRDIETIVAEGISCLDTMMNDIGRDPLLNGTMLVDANRLVFSKYKLDTRCDNYIFHISSIGTSRTHLSNPTQDNRLELLKDYLLTMFPPHHKFMLVQSAVASTALCFVIEGVLADLETIASNVNAGSTLFIPGYDSI